MSKVISVGTADIPYNYDQSVAKDFAHTLFSKRRKDIERLIGVFDNAMIENRHFCFPREWFTTDHSFVERTQQFKRLSYELSVDALNKCLENAGADYDDFDHIIFVSSTGMSAPTIDAQIINSMRLNNHIKRTPIWGLGCVGGAVGLSRAMDFTKADPKSGVLVIAVEICSLAFQIEDYSKSNVVAIALFSDGAACSLVVGNEHRLSCGPGMILEDSYSTTYYDSLDVMGWDIVETGFKAIFSKDIPMIVRNNVRENILEFLVTKELTLSDIHHYIVHPGGTKVINEYENSLDLENGTFHYPRKVLREHGNMSSATVLYVLDEFISDGKYTERENGLISALGPGFSSELLLFRTDK